MITQAMAKKCGWMDGPRYDLAVIGAGPAGIGAALAAARQGLRTVLIEDYGFAGGVATKSCVPLYFGFGVSGRQSTAGISEEFIRRMDEMGAASLIIDNGCAMPEFQPINGRPLTAKVQLQPETMKLVFERMLREAGVDCLFYAQMIDAVVEDGTIRAVLLSCLEGPMLLYANMFVDATGDGLLFRAAGAPVRKYAPEDGMHKSMFFMVGGVTPFDRAYNCALYKKAYEEGRLPEHVWNHFGYSVQLNPGVVQIAVVYAEGDSLQSSDMTRMSMEMRENVFAILRWLQEEMPGFSRCWLQETAGYVGVRIAQGITGMETLTEDMVQQGIATDEPVALTSRSYGAHANSAGKKFNAAWSSSEEGFSAVPMKAMISPALTNALAAGRCISSEPRVVGVFRMMNTCMTLGEAAGLVSVLSVGKDVRNVSYADLRLMLNRAGFILN